MNNLDYSSLVPGFKTGSESDFMHEYTTMNSKEIDETQPLETDIRFRIALGFTGFLIACLIFSICKAYCNRKREAEIREIWRLRESYTPPLTPSQNEERMFHGDYIQLRHLNRENFNEAEQGETESSTSCCLNPQQNEEIISLPEGYDESLFQNYLLQQGTECGPDLQGRHENRKDLYSEFLKGSPTSFSTPRESREGILLPPKSEGIGYASSIGKQMPGNSKTLLEKSSEEANVELLENTARKSTSFPERGTQSSPTSPDPVRRRFSSSEDTPQRPSSWM